MEQQEQVNRIRGVWEHFNLQLDLPLIDMQHLWLISLIVKLENQVEHSDALVSELKPENNPFLTILRETIDYTLEHFEVEELLLSRLAYPDLEEHKQGHAKFIALLKTRTEEFARGEARMADKLLRLLKRWLYSHVANDDHEYNEYLRKQGHDVRQACAEILKERPGILRKELRELYSAVLQADQIEIQETLAAEVVESVNTLWKQYNLSLGIPLIDMQHLWLLRTVVDLNRTLHFDYKSRRDHFNSALAHAIDYIKEHFATEEAIMQKCNYAGLDEHIKQHRAFIESIIKRNSQFKSGDESAIAGLLEDLKEWLLSHIAIEDKKLIKMAQGNRQLILDYSRQLIEEKQLVLRKGHLSLYKEIVK